MMGFFLKVWGFLKKVGIILQNVGIFRGIFDTLGGDFDLKKFWQQWCGAVLAQQAVEYLLFFSSNKNFH